MAKICYRAQRFNSKTRIIVDRANFILEDLASQGYSPTLRQLHYQFVRRNWMENTQKNYKRLGDIMSNARIAGETDWLHIQDLERGAVRFSDCPTYDEAFKGLEGIISINPWDDQDVYLEVGVEKNAQIGIVARPAQKWRAPYQGCKGYLSTSEAWRTGLRFQRAIAAGKRPIFIHLGDHDPSGLHMTSDNRDRIRMFARHDVEVVRIALTMEQVMEHECPPNPTKTSDSRHIKYEAAGHEASWELDALPPIFLNNLISDTIEGYIDKEKWKKSLEREAELREPLSRFTHRWEELIQLVKMDEKPLDRLAVLDGILADMPYHLGQAAHTMKDSLRQAINNSHALDKDALSIIRKPEPQTYIPGADEHEGNMADTGLDKGLELAAKALEGVKPLVWSEVGVAQSRVSWLTQTKEQLEGIERVPFELPETHEVPQAIMPWDEVDEHDALPDGFTDDIEDDLDDLEGED